MNANNNKMIKKNLTKVTTAALAVLAFVSCGVFRNNASVPESNEVMNVTAPEHSGTAKAVRNDRKKETVTTASSETKVVANYNTASAGTHSTVQTAVYSSTSGSEKEPEHGFVIAGTAEGTGDRRINDPKRPSKPKPGSGRTDKDKPGDEDDKPGDDEQKEKEDKRLKELRIALGIAEGRLDEAKANQLLAILEENEALSEYTSAKAAVITAKEDLDRFVKEHQDAVEEEESYKKILEAKNAVLDAAVAEYNEVVEKNALVSEYNDALGAFQTASEDLETALTLKAEAKDAVDTANTEYQNAIDAKTSADLALVTAVEKKDNADQELADAKAAKDKAVAALVAAKGNNAEAQKALQEANAAIETAQNNVNSAKETYEAAQEASVVAGVSVIDAQKAYDDACAALQEAQSAINQGTLGFFNANAGSENNDAADVLNYVFEMQEEGINKGITVNGSELEFKEHMYTNLGAENDATNLDNMRRSIELMKELNEIRASEGLEPLKVTDAMMAISEVQANIEYGLNVDYDLFMHNSGITAKYGVGENMAGVANETTDPFVGWYYDEKAVSEYMKEHNITSAYTAYRQMLSEGYDFGGYSVSSIGHYKNILRDYDVAGMGVRDKDSDLASLRKYGIATNNFAWLYGDTTTVTYTVEEYEALFEEYYEKVKGNLTAAQEAVEKAKAELDAALNSEDDAAENAKKLAEAETAYNEALKELETAQSNAEVKLEEAEEAQAAVDEAEDDVTEADDVLKEAEKSSDEAAEEVETAKDEAKAAEDDLKTAETAKADAEAALEEAETDAAEKQDAADKAKDDLAKASDAISDMSEEEIRNAKEIVEGAKANVDTAKGDVESAAKDCETAHQKTQDAERNAEAGRKAYDEAVTAENEAGQTYSDAVVARTAADAEVESAQSEVDEINQNIDIIEADPDYTFPKYMYAEIDSTQYYLNDETLRINTD